MLGYPLQTFHIKERGFSYDIHAYSWVWIKFGHGWLSPGLDSSYREMLPALAWQEGPSLPFKLDPISFYTYFKGFRNGSGMGMGFPVLLVPGINRDKILLFFPVKEIILGKLHRPNSLPVGHQKHFLGFARVFPPQNARSIQV